VVQRVRRDTAAVVDYSLLRGQFGVAGAAYDGSTTGLSADGRTLVLVGMAGNYPPTQTQLAVLDAVHLRAHARIALKGFFTVDAISPTGRWLYLIRYRSATNTNDYEVRAYDLVKQQLLVKPVLDPRQPGEKMHGVPVTRTISADGRWAYTFYSRGSAAPFIHALDTAGRTAFCVDLPAQLGADTSNIRLVLTAAALRVQNGGTPVALVNTRTFSVRSLAPATTPQRARPAASGHHGGGIPWWLAIVPLAALTGLALVARRRRRSPGPPAPVATSG
jgi:hypothetical protein